MIVGSGRVSVWNIGQNIEISCSSTCRWCIFGKTVFKIFSSNHYNLFLHPFAFMSIPSSRDLKCTHRQYVGVQSNSRNQLLWRLNFSWKKPILPWAIISVWRILFKWIIPYIYIYVPNKIKPAKFTFSEVLMSDGMSAVDQVITRPQLWEEVTSAVPKTVCYSSM